MRVAKISFIAVLLALLAHTGALCAPLTRGVAIPSLSTSPLIAPDDYRSLGLTATSGPVRLADIKGEMLVIELFNRFCMSCLKQAAEIEKFYQELKVSGLDGRIRVLAIGIGNGAQDLVAYKKVVPFTYPTAPDQSFDFYYGIGDIDSAPTTLFLRRKGDDWVVADGHLGIHGSVEMMARARILLENREGVMPPIDFSGKAKGVALSGAEKLEYAKAVLGRAGVTGGEPMKMELPGFDVYRATGADGKSVDLFAVVAKRLPVCDLCHESLFAFALDGSGKVVAFLPIYMTKFGNEIWSDEDDQYMGDRLKMGSGDGFAFSPEVDAVTSATMSSSLIFDEARRVSKALAAVPK